MFPSCIHAAALALCILGVFPVHAQDRTSTSNLRLSITLNSAPTQCATQSGAVVSVTCLTDSTPSFSAPGRPDVVAVSISASQSGGSLMTTTSSTAPISESAAQVPSTVNVSNLSPTAAGPGDSRTIESASMSAPKGSSPPEEIEVSF